MTQQHPAIAGNQRCHDLFPPLSSRSRKVHPSILAVPTTDRRMVRTARKTSPPTDSTPTSARMEDQCLALASTPPALLEGH